MPKLTLKALRVNIGLNQEEASEKLGIHASTLKNWEKGKTFPNTAHIEKICDLYKVNYDDIIFLPKENA